MADSQYCVHISTLCDVIVHTFLLLLFLSLECYLNVTSNLASSLPHLINASSIKHPCLYQFLKMFKI